MKNKIVILLFLLSPLFLHAQKQPKVGLVLSGGGAKGFAHVGVLKEIEKSGIQLDYIGGTSMGAIVGGLFAAGYTANQIEQIILKLDFIKELGDINPRDASPFFEKEYGEKHFITLPVDNGSIGLPRGFSKGQNVLNYLTELLAEVSSVKDFSKLDIPFFCLATNVENGEEVVLENGSLPLSLRASSSFPTVLNPVEINNQLLIDGGVANNFPSDIMKSKGVDFIIGVDVQSKLSRREKLTSAARILSQIIGYNMYKKSAENSKIVDVYIHPDLQKYNVADFQKSKEILAIGDKAGLKYREMFNEIAKKQSSKRERKKIKRNTSKIAIDEIHIDGLTNYTRAYVLGKLRIKKGDSLSHKEVAKRITFLSATKNFDLIHYDVSKKDSKGRLSLKVKESTQKASLKFGLHYDFLYKSSVLVNYTHKRLLGKNDVLSLDLVLGDNIRYNLSYFVDNGFYTSFGFRSRYNHFRANARFSQEFSPELGIGKIDVGYTDFTNELFLQTTFNKKFAVGLGAEFKYLEINTETLAVVEDEEVTFEGSNFLNAFAYLKLDTYNKKYFPTKGVFADVSFKWYAWSNRNDNLSFLAQNSGVFSPFYQGKGTLGFATSIKDKITFQYTGEMGLTSKNIVDFGSFDFILGGYNQNYINTLVPFYGYEFADLSDKSFLKSEFHLRYEFLKDNYAILIANFARLDSNVLSDIDLFKDIKSGYAIGYSINTGIGPIEFKYSWSPDTARSHLLFNLGFWF